MTDMVRAERYGEGESASPRRLTELQAAGAACYLEGCGLTSAETTLHPARKLVVRIDGIVTTLPVVHCTPHHLEALGLEVIASSDGAGR